MHPRLRYTSAGYARRDERSSEEEMLAAIAQLVERNLAKVDVAGSNPVSRSNDAKVKMKKKKGEVYTSFFERRAFLFYFCIFLFFELQWRRTQVVRERSAKPLCSGPNPLGASKRADKGRLKFVMLFPITNT